MAQADQLIEVVVQAFELDVKEIQERLVPL